MLLQEPWATKSLQSIDGISLLKGIAQAKQLVMTDLFEDSRDGIQPKGSWKTGLCFRSGDITDELAQIFRDTDSEGEFEGFSEDDSERSKSVTSGSDEDRDDIGFYSDGEEPASKKQRSSGLCVALKFPTKTSPAPKWKVAKQGIKETTPTAPPISSKSAGRNRKCEPGQTKGLVLRDSKRTKSQSNDTRTNVESLLTDEEMQILSKRAKNIEENKAMLAKLFADLSALPELPSKTTPTKKKKPPAPKRRLSDVQNERRNPSRKARPPEHFGLEVEEKSAPQKRESNKIDIQRLMEVQEGLRDVRPIQRKRRSRQSIRMPEDITEEELENVADRAKDKILDKDHGSTCHQCRQKTLDTKTECRGLYCQGVKGQFCGPCLRNRYGEDVRTALLDPSWECPICRGVCNCSLCRKRDGRCATGALTRLAKYYGHDNVKEYLESLQKNVE
ncbi:cell division cycle-associated 7-like protein isoform X1 [Myxocyprinus asiaticus]|uniref:cell division cycle-associated 7-like protein isoform X1 n=1 Tax=Myxocyprinus asiaticus TaxID=70543 RepID=UPI002221FD97|nr:cell division cycle-associated 7-like protein isoform X1 [Myxocyprinus asiaticus]